MKKNGCYKCYRGYKCEKTSGLCGFQGIARKCYEHREKCFGVTNWRDIVNNRIIRQIIYEICNQFYMRIKDEMESEAVNRVSQEYYEQYKAVPFALDLIRALVAQWCRENEKNMEGEVEKCCTL